MRMNIYTKHKLTAKEQSNAVITVSKSECFNGYVPQSAMSPLFNSGSAVKEFDKELHCLTHPTKGKLFLLPANVMKFVKIV